MYNSNECRADLDLDKEAISMMNTLTMALEAVLNIHKIC
jgi:hypothetical protein